MKVYQVAKYNPAEAGGEHIGYEYYSNRKDAEQAARTNDKEIIRQYEGIDNMVTVDDVEISKEGVLDYLNMRCGHPDNG